MEIKGIKYIGPILDGSGYANAAKGNILALHSLGVPLTLFPISFEEAKPDLGENKKVINELMYKEIDYNIVLIHTTPEFWEKYREKDKINIGYTIWETDRLHPDWPKYINNNVNKVLVGCTWNLDVFKNSGVNTSIGVVPHGLDKILFERADVFNIGGVSDDTYVFYDVFQWCYDDKTRVLTKNGFKYFKDLSYDDSIATLNMNNEKLEYQKPEKIVKFRRKDKMISMKGQFFDVCVTPDHKMVVKEPDDVKYKLMPFNDILKFGRSNNLIVPEKYKAKKNCKWFGREETVFKLPKLDNDRMSIRDGFPSEIDMDLFLEFLGWYLSEGSVYKAKNGYIITITQENNTYIDEIMCCVKNMGYTPFIRKKDIRFNSRELCYYLKQFGKCNDKFIPDWVKELSSRQITILLLSLFKGNGSLYKNGKWMKYVTTSKKLAEDVQECLLKVGISGSVSVADPKTKKCGEIDGRKIKSKLLQYTVSVNNKRNEPSMYYSNINEVNYDGFVYCATVPNHAMLVERNGKVIFSGNTERKNPLALIKAYWYAFQNDENVALVLKTYRSDYSQGERDAIRVTIQRMKQVTIFDNYPKIYLITDMLTDDEMYGLYKRGDCYVSFDRGEGFGLGPFSAAACGKPIIITGFGGATEYAKEDNSYLVNYTQTPVFGMPWSPWYRGDQLWAEPDVYHGATLLKHVYENKEEAKEKGLKIQKYIEDNFSWEKVGKKIIEEIENIQED